MAISNELSSEIAAALLANRKSPTDLMKLKDVLIEVHHTLQQMDEEVYARRSEVTTNKVLNSPDHRQH